jgi:hypothetical protein
MSRLAIALCLGLLAGCGEKDKTPTKVEKPHDHSDHDKGKAKLEDGTLPDGKKAHIGLTAHISKKEGNALDVFFETFDGKPLTISEKAKLTAEVVRGEEKFKLDFEPAPKDERKDDPAGQCSRFAADAPWLKPDDTLKSVTLTIEGTAEKVVWIDFNVKKYSHVEE